MNKKPVIIKLHPEPEEYEEEETAFLRGTRFDDSIKGLAMPDDRSHALILYMFAAVAGLSFFAAVYFVAWAYR